MRRAADLGSSPLPACDLSGRELRRERRGQVSLLVPESGGFHVRAAREFADRYGGSCNGLDRVGQKRPALTDPEFRRLYLRPSTRLGVGQNLAWVTLGNWAADRAATHPPTREDREASADLHGKQPDWAFWQAIRAGLTVGMLRSGTVKRH